MALDGEVDAFAEAGAVDCCFAHGEICEVCDVSVEPMNVKDIGKQTATESTIIIDQNLLGVCLGTGLRPWRGDGSVSNHCHLDSITWFRWPGSINRSTIHPRYVIRESQSYKATKYLDGHRIVEE